MDVQYDDSARVAAAAVVTFLSFSDATPTHQLTLELEEIAPYVPGQFWQRELPCLMALLERLETPPQMILVDGYVWLDHAGRKGLGAHLYSALNERIPVIGVAKTAFLGSTHAEAVLRGKSTKPLYITAAGISNGEAAQHVTQMQGEHRIPTLLKQVDRLCRDALLGRAKGGNHGSTFSV